MKRKIRIALIWFAGKYPLLKIIHNKIKIDWVFDTIKRLPITDSYIEPNEFNLFSSEWTKRWSESYPTEQEKENYKKSFTK